MISVTGVVHLVLIYRDHENAAVTGSRGAETGPARAHLSRVTAGAQSHGLFRGAGRPAAPARTRAHAARATSAHPGRTQACSACKIQSARIAGRLRVVQLEGAHHVEVDAGGSLLVRLESPNRSRSQHQPTAPRLRTHRPVLRWAGARAGLGCFSLAAATGAWAGRWGAPHRPAAVWRPAAPSPGPRRPWLPRLPWPSARPGSR